MENSLQALVSLSNKYGTHDYVIAAGGNSSFKDPEHIWVKASGYDMSVITAEDFVRLSRSKLFEISSRGYSSDPGERDHQVTADIAEAIVPGETSLKPSVETLIHNLLAHAFVIHTHPYTVNGLLCSNDAARICGELFEKAVYIEYADPGYSLFRKAEEAIGAYRLANTSDPNILLVRNHGIFVAADTEEEVNSLYDDVISKITARFLEPIPEGDIPIDPEVTSILPAIRSMLSVSRPGILTIRSNALIRHFSDSPEEYGGISSPFTPDNIIHCGSGFLFVDLNVIPEQYPDRFRERLRDFTGRNNYDPVIMVLRGYGIVAFAHDAESADAILDTFEDMMKISFISRNFGGPSFMSPESIEFIEKRVKENTVAGVAGTSKIEGKVAIVTGGSQGFGEGIVRDFHLKGANVIIADIKDTEGANLTESLNESGRKNIVHYVHTDVSDLDSLQNLVFQAVCNFGGVDIVVSNAGILRAGTIDLLDVNTFELVTKINYTAYFMVVKAFSPVLKLQTKYNPSLFTDIIQINSKSGLRGSNKNFAYAGGKFGGIGLTQSFALELIQYRIKVNSVCPGNFFDGPLWSDPDNGLFVQYLRAGKVPGAKTIDDVKRYYESQVPANRGCRVEDVMKAIYYIIDQEYETGQAVPVTGGQVMLS